jgi:hypothetical protein
MLHLSGCSAFRRERDDRSRSVTAVSAEPTHDPQPPAPAARTTAACLLWAEGLAVLVWAGILLPEGLGGATAGGARVRVLVTLLVLASCGAAAVLVGTGLWRSRRGGRAAALAVQAVLLAVAVQSHRFVVIAVAAAVSVVSAAVVLWPALGRETTDDGPGPGRPPVGPTPNSARAPGD